MDPRLKALYEALAPIRPKLINAASMVQDIATQALQGNKSTGAQFYRQMANKPGVKPAQLEAAYGHLKDSPIMMSRDDFIAAGKKPKLAVQRGASTRVQEDPADVVDNEWADDRVRDLYWQDADNIAWHENDMKARILAAGITESEEEAAQLVALAMDNRAVPAGVERAVADSIEQFWNRNRELYDQVYAQGYQDYRKAGPRFTPAYAQYQRQTAMGHDPQYFESVLRVPPKQGLRTGLSDRHLNSYGQGGYGMHFGNYGQIGHARGNIYTSPRTNLPAVQLEEVQSDPLEVLGAIVPELKTPHANVAKAMLLQAAKGDASAFSIPNALAIANIRERRLLPFYQSIYDDELGKHFFGPLDTLGIRAEENAGQRILELTPEINEALRKKGLPFKKGGLVQMAEGGQPPESSFWKELLYGSPDAAIGTTATLAEMAGAAVPLLKKFGAGLNSWPATIGAMAMTYSPDTGGQLDDNMEIANAIAASEGVPDWVTASQTYKEQLLDKVNTYLQELEFEKQQAEKYGAGNTDMQKRVLSDTLGYNWK